MAIIGLDGAFVRVNRALTELLGYEEAAFLHAGMALVHRDAEVSDEWRRLVAGELDRYQRDRAYRHADGSTIWGALTMALVRDDDGAPLYAIGQLEDITARKA